MGQLDTSIRSRLDACDCHVHVFDDPASTAMEPDRAYTPPAARVGDLKIHMIRVGVERCVLVQPSVYGTDNSVMTRALETLGPCARAICVASPSITASELADLHAIGVRGIRINLESAGKHEEGAVERALSGWPEKIGPLGWHVQLYAAFDAVVAAEAALRAIGLPIVLDHFANLPLAAKTDQQRAVAFLSNFMANGPAYLKCSGFYRVPNATVPALSEIVQTLFEAAPSRLLWASDWPHTARLAGAAPTEISPFRIIKADEILAHRSAWFATDAVRDQILTENPARLYDFSV